MLSLQVDSEFVESLKGKLITISYKSNLQMDSLLSLISYTWPLTFPACYVYFNKKWWGQTSIMDPNHLSKMVKLKSSLLSSSLLENWRLISGNKTLEANAVLWSLLKHDNFWRWILIVCLHHFCVGQCIVCPLTYCFWLHLWYLHFILNSFIIMNNIDETWTRYKASEWTEYCF
jgi:hypothetical protein